MNLVPGRVLGFNVSSTENSYMVYALRREWLLARDYDHMAEYEGARRVLKEGANPFKGLEKFELCTSDFAEEDEETSRSFLAELDTVTAVEVFEHENGTIAITVFSKSSGRHALSTLKKLLDEHTDLYEEEEPEGDNLVSVGFWNMGDAGAERSGRYLEMHKWEDVDRNYPSSCHDAVAELVKLQGVPAQDGKLILMHGPAGTGKTSLIRALALEWKDWTQFDIITDPEIFLAHPKYLNTVMMNSHHDPEQWRVLVMEDCGELLGGDAKERAGQGLSRLLNVSDGLLGQGQRLLFLITTNEDIKTLHPAVVRPGRCLSNLHIGHFDPEEASTWLSNEQRQIEVKKQMTLAEMYQFRMTLEK